MNESKLKVYMKLTQSAGKRVWMRYGWLDEKVARAVEANHEDWLDLVLFAQTGA